MKQTLISNSFEETKQYGRKLAKTLKGGEVLCLYGDLGSGKTTFVQGLAQGLGIKKRITSPTFIIMRSYKLPFEEKQEISINPSDLCPHNFYHIDLYRIDSGCDIQGLGIEELLGDPDSITAIEWPEKIKSILAKRKIEIFFTYVDEDKRKITMIEE